MPTDKNQNTQENQVQTAQDETQSGQDTTQGEKSFNERVNEALNSQSVSEQIKTTLLVAFELVQGFDELNEHYRKDLEKFNDNFTKSNELYEAFVAEKTKFEKGYTEILENLNQTSKDFKDEVERIETLKKSFETMSANIETMSNNITKQQKEIEKLVDSLDLADIDERIKELKAKKAEFDEYIPQLDNKKAEFEAFVAQQKVDLEQYIAQFRASLDEIDFVQDSAPNSGLNGQSWLDTSKGIINIFSQNERIRFVQKDEPTNYARLNDGWHKFDDTGAVDELKVFKPLATGNEWVDLELNALDFDKIEFKQLDEPDTAGVSIGTAWLKMSPLNVYYLENKSFVQIDKKLVRFISENEPDANKETIQLNDIWKKSDEEVFICTSYAAATMNPDKESEVLTPAKATWTLLELAYKTAKFKRVSLPSESEIAGDDETDNVNKVQMRDLVFVVDESELYYFVKNSFNGSDETDYAWVKKAEFSANARFQGLSEPQELFENDLWFATQSDERQTRAGTQGTLKVCKPKEQRANWISLTHAKKYAAFKSELTPDTKYCKDYDAWYRPLSDELYIFYGGYFHFVNKCNAILKHKITGEMPDPLDSSKTMQYTTIRWIMRKFAGWQSIVMPHQVKCLEVWNYDPDNYGNPQPLNAEFLNAKLEFYSSSVIYPAVFSDVDFIDADDKLYFEKINALSDDEMLICINVTQSYEWKDAVYPQDISAFLWQNELDKRVNVIEKLFLPNDKLSSKALQNEIITPTYPQQVVNVAFLNGALSELDEKISRKDNEYLGTDTDGVNIDTSNTTAPRIELNFSYGKNFSIDLTNETLKNFELNAVNDEQSLKELQGQSGVIAVKDATKLKTTLGTGFNVRVALQGLTALEIFSYVIFEDKIRLTRS